MILLSNKKKPTSYPKTVEVNSLEVNEYGLLEGMCNEMKKNYYIF